MTEVKFVFDWYRFYEPGNIHEFCLQMDFRNALSYRPQDRDQAFHEIRQWLVDLDLERKLWAYRFEGPSLLIAFRDPHHAMLFRLKFC